MKFEWPVRVYWEETDTRFNSSACKSFGALVAQRKKASAEDADAVRIRLYTTLLLMRISHQS